MWANSHKWVVRFAYEEKPCLEELEELICEEGIDILTKNTFNSLIHFACLGESTTVISYLLQRDL